MLEKINTPLINAFPKTRPKSIRIYRRTIINSDYGPINAINFKDLKLGQSRSPRNNEDLLFENLISIRNLNQYTQNSRNTTPVSNINKETKTLLSHSDSVSEENSPLFYPKEPRIHTTMSKKQRSEIPKQFPFMAMKKVNWVFKLSKKKTKWKSLSREHKLDLLGSGSRLQQPKNKGKVYKGMCEHPQLFPSPIRIHNIKFSP